MNWPKDFLDRVICGDCLDVMKEIPDEGIDVVIADPPYGINMPTEYKTRGRGKWTVGRDYPRVYGDDKPFDPAPILEKFYQVPIFLFGANYYAKLLPETSSWYVWDKRDGMRSNDQADCELIWSNVGKGARIFSHRWSGCLKASEKDQQRVHPTQKPVALMKWLIWHHSKHGDIILDPYMGSGSTLVAAKQLGRRYIGIEINPDYCKIAEQRLAQGEMQLK